MGNMTNFYTQTVEGTQGPAPLATGAKSSAVTGGAGTGTFLDLLLSTLITGKTVATPAIADAENADKNATQDPVFDPLLPLQTTQVAPVTDDIVKAVDAKADELTAFDAVNLIVPAPVVTAAPAAKAGIDTATIPTDENAEIDAALLSAIEPGVEGGKIDDALRAQLAALGIDLTGQTPALPADLDGATPVAPVTDGAAAKTAAQPAPAVLSAPVDAATEPTGEIAAQLNALNVGAGKPDTAKTDGKDGKATSLIDALMRGMNADDAYKPVLNTAPVTQNTPAQTPATGGQTALPAAANDAALMDDPLFKIDLSALSPDRLLGLSNAAVQVTGNAAKHAAGTPAHSALSAVALHLQSLAQNRDTRSLTLQLNPPELGKLQVKMTYGRDKTVKADIAVEKSDTLALLQKDADGLRQALSDAGLNADAGSLNFSLANDNTFADQMQDGEGDGRGSGNTDSDIELGAIEIKSSEEWSVDSRTGIVRYNIVV